MVLHLELRRGVAPFIWRVRELDHDIGDVICGVVWPAVSTMWVAFEVRAVSVLREARWLCLHSGVDYKVVVVAEFFDGFFRFVFVP